MRNEFHLLFLVLLVGALKSTCLLHFLGIAKDMGSVLSVRLYMVVSGDFSLPAEIVLSRRLSALWLVVFGTKHRSFPTFQLVCSCVS